MDIADQIQTLTNRIALLEQRTADETAAIRAELVALQGESVVPACPLPSLSGSPSAPRTERERVDLSWLAGPTGLAVAGGVVTLLGIVFVFALAASRGWIGPAVRCSIGGGVSILLVGLAVLIRRRYGHVVAGLAAAGAGIGGLYITLYAASRGYHLLGTSAVWGAVVVVAILAAALALAWSSELLAVLGLAAVVIAPPTVEDKLTRSRSDGVGDRNCRGARDRPRPELAAARRPVVRPALRSGGRVHLRRSTPHRLRRPSGWHHRLSATSLAIETFVLAIAGAVAYGRGRQKSRLHLAARDVDAAALAARDLGAARRSGERGVVLLAVAAAYALSAGAAAELRERDLGVLLLALALFTAALATAFLLSNGGLVVAWTLEGLTFLGLARQLKRPTFQVAGLAYLTAAAAHLLVLETPLDHLFTEQAHPAQHLGLLALFVLALAGAALLLYGLPLLGDRFDLAAAGASALLPSMPDRSCCSTCRSGSAAASSTRSSSAARPWSPRCGRSSRSACSRPALTRLEGAAVRRARPLALRSRSCSSSISHSSRH